MSLPLFPCEPWMEGMEQPRLVVNDNFLVAEMAVKEALAGDVSSQPVAPVEGDLYILPASPTGAQWSDFEENDLALYRGGTWYARAPVEGLFKPIAGSLYVFESGAWVAVAGGGGSGAAWGGITGTLSAQTDLVAALESSRGTTTITDATTARNLAASDDNGYSRFTNPATKTLTVRPNATAALPADGEFSGRNVGAGALTIVAGAGVTINLPTDGTLVVPQGGTYTLKRVATDEFDLFGVTVPV